MTVSKRFMLVSSAAVTGGVGSAALVGLLPMDKAAFFVAYEAFLLASYAALHGVPEP